MYSKEKHNNNNNNNNNNNSKNKNKKEKTSKEKWMKETEQNTGVDDSYAPLVLNNKLNKWMNDWERMNDWMNDLLFGCQPCTHKLTVTQLLMALLHDYIVYENHMCCNSNKTITAARLYNFGGEDKKNTMEPTNEWREKRRVLVYAIHRRTPVTVTVISVSQCQYTHTLAHTTGNSLLGCEWICL